jgi:alpha-glucuronidase
MRTKLIILFGFLLLFISFKLNAEDGYNLWLRYYQVKDTQELDNYRNNISQVVVFGNTATMLAAKEELKTGLTGLLGTDIEFTDKMSKPGALLVGTPQNSDIISGLIVNDQLKTIGKEGFIIKSTQTDNNKVIVVAGNTEIGALYGVFNFLRLLQTESDLSQISIVTGPKVQLRLIDHWDNLTERIERGYAGESLWRWDELPEYKNPRYKDYARAEASIGINGVVLNNVSATPLILLKEYLVKIVTIAEVLRPYGIKVYLSINFASPKELDGLPTADPLDPQVSRWWKNKADEIYKLIPDFGGFLVKANSEGLPGPMDFGRTHVDGANMLADALAPHNGIVMWRAFVYKAGKDDRAKQGYAEFVPFDGRFRKNVIIQVKNGPVDFQPREPFHPLFGAMPKTNVMMEFQITQEYLGFVTHLAYLAPLYKECLESETYAKGKGSTVAKVLDGSVYNYSITGMAGVANTGSDRNWCGHPFGAANWYAYGRLAWDYNLTPEEIAVEWIGQTFSNNKEIVSTILSLMLPSREAVVNYMTPMGLAHLMGWGHHYGPQPWFDKAERPDWNPVYYHKADGKGLGFNRSKTGSNAVAQYFPPAGKIYDNPDSCPENLILWFHHVDWTHKMKDGRTLWDELCYKYYSGVDTVRKMEKIWSSLEGKIDDERFQDVKARLAIQEREATWWRDACVQYFQTFSRLPIPADLEKPLKSFDELKKIYWKIAPGF